MKKVAQGTPILNAQDEKVYFWQMMIRKNTNSNLGSVDKSRNKKL